jgi:hypothetical protein
VRARSWFALGVTTALFLPACMGDDAEGEENATNPPAPATTEAEPTSVSPPSDLTAEANAFSVVLTWVAPVGDPQVEEYTVYRDGSPISSVPAPEASFTDEDVVPGRRYSYEVEAQAGELVSTRVAAETTTPTPPLRAARVEGTFSVRTKELSSTGYTRLREPTYGWQFRPRCRSGACDVRWSSLQQKRVRGLVNRHGARYQGSYTGFFNVLCSGARATSSVTIRFRVAAARPIGSEWRAARLLGTLTQSEAAQLGCVSSRAKLAIRARFVQ